MVAAEGHPKTEPQMKQVSSEWHPRTERCTDGTATGNTLPLLYVGKQCPAALASGPLSLSPPMPDTEQSHGMLQGSQQDMNLPV